MRFLPIFGILPFLAGCGRAPEPLPVYNTVAEFTLTDHTGEEFHSASLRGAIWVADFIFTSCTGPCPRMSSQMRQLQSSLEEIPEVKLVSFTVDPARDTPEALAAYANRYKAEAGRWYLLTGPAGILHRLNRETFMLGNVDGSLDHSTRFVLIDRESRVRGYYPSSESDAMERLRADIRRLSRERS